MLFLVLIEDNLKMFCNGFFYRASGWTAVFYARAALGTFPLASKQSSNCHHFGFCFFRVPGWLSGHQSGDISTEEGSGWVRVLTKDECKSFKNKLKQPILKCSTFRFLKE